VAGQPQAADAGAAGARVAFGDRGVEGADCYTATGFANPARRVLAPVLHTRSEVRPRRQAPAVRPPRAYLAYMLIALVALLALVSALA
jgi:hypothetical protein